MKVIYGLVDPRTAIIRYVGYTGEGAQKRLQRHLKEARSGTKNHRCNWLRELVSLGMTPSVLVLEQLAPSANWADREKFWIASYPVGSLVNGTIGGDGRTGPFPMASRIKVSRALTGRKCSPEHGRNVSRALKGVKRSPAYIEMLRNRKHSPEVRAVMSAKAKGRTFSPATRAKIAKTLSEKPFDERRSEQLAQARGVFDEKRAAQLAAARATRWSKEKVSP